MLITVVTVCLNCEKVIGKTIESVLKQKCKNFEYIIVDGKSKDATLEIAKNKTQQYDNVKIFSEKDSGIYDAMNKAANLASGQFIYFLNAGDYFYNDKVLENVQKYLESNNDIYYGNVEKKEKIETYPKNLSWNYLVAREKMVCHQAIFAKTDILRKNPFNLEYRICADRDWLIRCKYLNKKMQYMKDIIVAYYDTNGKSSIYKNFEVESIDIAKKYGSIITVIFVKLKRFLGRIYHHR